MSSAKGKRRAGQVNVSQKRDQHAGPGRPDSILAEAEPSLSRAEQQSSSASPQLLRGRVGPPARPTPLTALGGRRGGTFLRARVRWGAFRIRLWKEVGG